MEKTYKTCNKCGKELPIDDFFRFYKHLPAKRSDCKNCTKAISKQRRDRVKNTLQYKREMLHYRLKSTYGMTLARYDEMLVLQSGVCAICKQPNNVIGERLGVDHDHKTDQIRGLLCNHCNKGLAGFLDNSDNLKSAIKYLKEYNNGS